MPRPSYQDRVLAWLVEHPGQWSADTVWRAMSASGRREEALGFAQVCGALDALRRNGRALSGYLDAAGQRRWYQAPVPGPVARPT